MIQSDSLRVKIGADSDYFAKKLLQVRHRVS